MHEYKRNPNIKCVICLSPIYRRPAEIEKTQGKVYCSSTCYGISSRKEHPCTICAKPILSHLNKKTCSRTCANIQRAGIKYKIGRPRDKVTAARTLKIRLLEIKGRKCERCNYDKIRILQVHHKDRNRLNNSAENLEIVCPNCHYEEHIMEGNLSILN